MLVSQILREKGRAVVSIRPNATLFEAAHVLNRHRIGALPVLDFQGVLHGIISERDLIRALAEDGAEALGVPVSARMTREVATCTENASTEEIMERMTSGRFRHMPVMNGAGMTGLVSIGDVVKARLFETVSEAETLKHYIAAG
jgi:CBS domain-containing protein